MVDQNQHIVNSEVEARQALRALEFLKYFVSKTLFVVNNENILVGALTDGDIRRGLLNGLEISQPINLFMNSTFRYLVASEDNFQTIKQYRNDGVVLIPLIDDKFRILEVLDLTRTKTILPIAALIMAGGRGERLRPLTQMTPKPMLKIGDKPIIEHNIDRLISYGIKDIYISVEYLKEQVMSYFGDGSGKGINIHYIEETEPLGTIGAISLIENFAYEDILVMNSDLLTNIDFEDFYDFYMEKNASMALASIPYKVTIPYAVLETLEEKVESFTEKPNYTYYSNGGIYLLKIALRELFARGKFFNATDLMDKVIATEEHNLVHFPLLGYWLDIGRHQDYLKAQEDIKHLRF